MSTKCSIRGGAILTSEVRFLIECYFGDISDPILATINRAYLDMQAHTVSGDKENVIFPKRKAVTEYLYNRLQSINKNDNYNNWHKETANHIKTFIYRKMSYGQIQKWINMSVKYLYTLKQLGVDGISDSFDVDQRSKFHAPIDSYVLNELKVKEEVWSSISNYDSYDKYRKMISFEKEYDEWPEYRRKAFRKKDGTERLAEKGSYRRYVQDQGGYKF